MDHISFALQIGMEIEILTRKQNQINCAGTNEIKFVVPINDFNVSGRAIYFNFQ
jgi:hypothetical protein